MEWVLQSKEHYVLKLRKENGIIVEVESGWKRKQGTQWLSFGHNVKDLSFCTERNGKHFILVKCMETVTQN